MELLVACLIQPLDPKDHCKEHTAQGWFVTNEWPTFLLMLMQVATFCYILDMQDLH